MRVIDSYCGCPFYAVMSDSAKSANTALTAEKARKDVYGNTLASQTWVAGRLDSKLDTTAILDQFSIVNKTDTATTVSWCSIANGISAKANSDSLANGFSTQAVNYSLANGQRVTATTASIAVGDTCSAKTNSVAIGNTVIATAQSLAVGMSTKATDLALALGGGTTASMQSFALGGGAIASTNSFAQGAGVNANAQSFAQGTGNTATTTAFAQGGGNTATDRAMAQGWGNSAYLGSIAQGIGNTASNYSQAFGLNSIITDNGMAIGQYNKTTADVAFVIGNGDSTANRSDLFVIDKNGNVSAKSGYFYDKDGKVGSGGGGATGDYVPLTALDCKIGANTSAVNVALAQGQNCYADKYSVAQGYYSSAYGNSLAIGYYNKAGDSQYWPESIVEGDVIPARTDYYGNSLAVGNCNSASFEALAVGDANTAMSQALALGTANNAGNASIAVGTNNKAIYKAVCFGSYNYANFESVACGYYNYAAEDSYAFGSNLKAYLYSNAGNVRHGTFAIGAFNKTSAAPFVIGDGVGDSDRSDLFVIDANGNISAKGQLYVGVKTQGGTTTAMSTNELLTKLNALYALVAANSGSSNWHTP